MSVGTWQRQLAEKETANRLLLLPTDLAERVGFEPTEPF